MSGALVGWAALGGGMGAALRYAVDVAVTARWRRPFPLATLVVNVSGSLLLGLLVGALADPAAGAATGPTPGSGSATLLALLGTGVLGGYTTFSTASHDAIRLARAGDRGTALAYAVATMLATVLAALLGLWLGGRV